MQLEIWKLFDITEWVLFFTWAIVFANAIQFFNIYTINLITVHAQLYNLI